MSGDKTDLTGLASRLSATGPYAAAESQPQASTFLGSGWFGPMAPMAPVAPPDVAGRRFDYPFGYNLQIATKFGEGYSFGELRALAQNCWQVRLAIETRKDQLETLSWHVRPRMGRDKKPLASSDDPAIDKWTKILTRPDGRTPFHRWMRVVREDVFVLDAPAIYRHRARSGELLALEYIDGATIKPVIDDWGRTPEPPAPAYQQILKGMPAVDCTAEDLYYYPRNRRAGCVYGFSPVEQVVLIVNIALRRDLFTLDFFTEGNMPAGLLKAPKDWTKEQIESFQLSFDAWLSGNAAARSRLKLVPNDGQAGTGVYQQLKTPELSGMLDEWLARVVCFAFSLPPSAFVKQQNRATSQSDKARAEEEGLGPWMTFEKELLDEIIYREDPSAAERIEFDWIDEQQEDKSSQAVILTSYVDKGLMTVNEGRERLGLDPVDGGDELRVLIATGFVPFAVNDDMPTAGDAASAKQQSAKDSAQALAQQTPEPAPEKETAGKAARDTFRKGAAYWQSHQGVARHGDGAPRGAGHAE